MTSTQDVRPTEDFSQSSHRFMNWLKQNPGVRVNPKIKIADLRSRDAGRGVVACKDLVEDEELFAIPEDLVLSVRNSSLKDHVNLAEEDLDSWLSLVVVMIHEYLQGGESRWAPYFQILPEEFNTLMFWTDNELRELQGSSVLDKIGKREADETIAEKVIPIVLKFPQLFPTAAANFPSFDSPQGRNALLSLAHRMATLIMAYAFDIEVDQDDESQGNDEDGYMTDDEQELPKGMVPLADILNADGNRNNARLFQEDGYFVMKSIMPIAAGEEVFNDYGDLPRADLLRRYGYITDSYTPYDVVELNLQEICEAAGMDNGSLGSDNPVLEFLDSQDALEDGYSIPRPSAGMSLAEMVPDDLLVLLHSISLSPAQQQQMKSKMKVPKVELGLSEATLLAKIIRKKGSEYATTVEQDQEALRKLAPSATTITRSKRRQAMAIQVRLGEKEILTQFLTAADAYVSQAAEGAPTQDTQSTDNTTRERKRQRRV